MGAAKPTRHFSLFLAPAREEAFANAIQVQQGLSVCILFYGFGGLKLRGWLLA
jgi:hypothetical protein